MTDLQPGTVLGDRFELVGALGRGGMATVYLARDRVRGEDVALKVLHPHLARSDTMRRRLRREVQAAAKVRHPNALVGLDLYELDGQLAVSMPVHPGVTLTEHVERHGPLTGAALEKLATQVLGALRAAHQVGLVHRDVTPSNVLVDAHGDAVLTDFGLARFADQHTRTSTGALGTPGYAAPETYSGTRGDPRSDLYGLGAVLYQAATGAPPFGTGDPMAVLSRQLAGDHTPLTKARPDLPKPLAATIDAMLSLDPSKRPQGAPEALAALRGPVREPSPAKTPHKPTQTSTRVLKPLGTGSHTVVVREMRRDRDRRRALREGRRKQGFARDLERLAEDVRTWLMRDLMGRPVERTPEGRLAAAVAKEAGLDADALEIPAAMLEKEFRLVERVDPSVAEYLVSEARNAGFDARMVAGSLDDAPRTDRRWLLIAVLIAVLGLGPAVILTLNQAFGFDLPTPMILFGLFFLIPFGRRRRPKALSNLPLAYTRDLRRHMVDGGTSVTRHDATPEAPRASAKEPSLADRTLAQLDALDALIRDRDGLPDVARRDLQDTVASLRAQAVALGRAAATAQRELASTHEADTTAAVERVEGRLQRLRTLARAGGDHATEIAELERALASHQRTLELAEQHESRLTTVMARLLEVGGAAAEARAKLADTPKSADALLASLRTETAAASEAAREVDVRPMPREGIHEGEGRRRPERAEERGR